MIFLLRLNDPSQGRGGAASTITTTEIDLSSELAVAARIDPKGRKVEPRQSVAWISRGQSKLASRDCSGEMVPQKCARFINLLPWSSIKASQVPVAIIRVQPEPGMCLGFGTTETSPALLSMSQKKFTHPVRLHFEQFGTTREVSDVHEAAIRQGGRAGLHRSCDRSRDSSPKPEATVGTLQNGGIVASDESG
jgi:hypothetical protein